MTSERLQKEVELDILSILENSGHQPMPLLTSKHIAFARGGMRGLPSSYSSLDASRPWLAYWTMHAVTLLSDLTEDEKERGANFLARCQDEEGGFGGGPGQLPHLATSYAAVNAIVIMNSPAAYRVVNRENMYRFLLRMKQPNGGFTMHDGGEVDVRGVYTALVISSVLGIADEKITRGCAEYIARCQSFDGGFSGEPGGEAHGGYAFCAVAALVILGQHESKLVDWKAFNRWLVLRQMSVEGGFQGRTNKLVDGCYSMWQGGAFALLSKNLLKMSPLARALARGERGSGFHPPPPSTSSSSSHPPPPLLNLSGLDLYIRNCCQEERGGLRDKPGKSRDHYHTCYCLSGLSVVSDAMMTSNDGMKSWGGGGEEGGSDVSDEEMDEPEVKPVDPILNVSRRFVDDALLAFPAIK